MNGVVSGTTSFAALFGEAESREHPTLRLLYLYFDVEAHHTGLTELLGLVLFGKGSIISKFES
jgi:hypothetical protein